MKKAFIILTILIISLGVASVARAGGASLYFSPNSGTFFIGSTFDVSIFVNTGDNNINVVQVDLKFDPKKLQIASPTAGKSFIDVWVSQPTYSNTEGTASFKGGIPSPGINISSGLFSTITFRAISPGETKISFLDSSRVLLDDGKGTNILTSTGHGVYILSIPPPEGPEVFSPTHSDQNKWYKNNNPTFSWVKEGGINNFSYNLDHDPQGIPDNVPEGDHTSISYSNLEDGIWYFHVKAKKAEVWGGISHYLVQIDITPPAGFVPEIDPSTKTSVLRPIISFITTDNLSGFDHFEAKIINITPDENKEESGFFIEVVSPYKLPSLQIGKYLSVIRAFDKAANWRDASIRLEIIPGGLGFSKQGILIFGFFLEWWMSALLLLLIIILATGFLLLRFKKQRVLQLEIKERLERREAELRKEAEKIKNITNKVE